VSTALPAPVIAILNATEPAGLTELERVLRARLAPPSTAAERRVAELGPLARMLEAEGVRHWLGFRVVDRQDYDARRPADAPVSHTLVLRFHTWAEVCRAADGLLDDGRYRGAGRPWPQRRGITPPRYTEDDCLDGIRVCRRELGREPSSNEYALWCRARRESARRTSAETLPPTLKTIYRFFPASEGGWASAVFKAGV
jgi:hypothetical protein